MIRFAVLGCGRIGRMHARNIAAHPRAELVSVYDVAGKAAEDTAAELGAKVAGSVDEALADGRGRCRVHRLLDRHPCRPAHPRRQGRQGGPVREADRPRHRSVSMPAGPRSAGSIPLVMVGFNRRFDPSFKALRDRLQAGEIGKLEQVVITSRDPAPAARRTT